MDVLSAERVICVRRILSAFSHVGVWGVVCGNCRDSSRHLCGALPQAEQLIFAVTNVIQTIPALAMLSVLMLVLGLGANTVILSLFLYSLLPIIRNTYTGIVSIEHAYLESGKAMGMTKWQVLRMVELPLALSVIMAGLRTALVIAIGITAIGTFVGAGGLGDIIIRGSNATNGTAIILAGAIPTALMAIMADLVMGWLERYLSPTNKKKERKALAEKTSHLLKRLKDKTSPTSVREVVL